MAASPEFVEFVLEQMAELGRATARRMFGGAGIYRDGVMFALIADDVLYFKVAASNSHDFDTEGLEPFFYISAAAERDGNVLSTSTGALLGGPTKSMAEWCRMAWAAACERPERRRRR